jgi:hypothetical protein
MLNESYVQVAVDGAGKKIRNLSSYQLIDPGDGTGPVATLVQNQITGVTDEQGRTVDLNIKDVLEHIALSNDQISASLALLVGLFGGEADDELQDARPTLAGVLASVNLPAAVRPFTIARQLGDPFGRAIMLPWGARDLYGAASSGAITDTAAHNLTPAIPDAYADLLAVIIANTSASTSARADISDGTTTYSFQSIGGAGPVGFSGPGILKAAAINTAWTITMAGGVTDIRATAIYVKNRP